MSVPAPQRAFALEIVQRLRAAGFEALWAGGCVRDELLGREPKDYDVATSATPDQIRDLFGRRRTLPIGAAFGVVTVLGPRPAGQLDVATFRSDATYSDGRHPDSVSFTTAEQDAQRRDFTINGLFFDPVAGQVVDFVGGRDDLARRVIRAIGEPRARLSEDKLRMLRAVRFAAAFDFQIDPATLAAIQTMAAEVTTVSAERIGVEIRRMLVDANRAVALDLLRETKLLPQVLPEIAALAPAAFNETKGLLQQLVTPTLSLAIAALLIKVTPPAINAGLANAAPASTSPFPAPRSLLPASPLARRLRFTTKETERAEWLLRNIAQVAAAPQLPWPQLQRLLIHDGAAELIALREALAGPADPSVVFCRERLAWPAARLNPPLLVSGGDLIAHGLSPGPDFTPLLEQIRDAQLLGQISTRNEALALVDRLR